MYIQHKLVVTSILTLCMLTISFLLSSLTVLQNTQQSQMGTNRLAQNDISALLIESMPESCEGDKTPESETCLRVNVNSTNDLASSQKIEDDETTKESIVLVASADSSNISNTRRQKNRSHGVRESNSAVNDEDETKANFATADAFDKFRSNATTVAIIIPEPTATAKVSEPIVTTVLNTNRDETSNAASDTLQRANQLACEMATRQWFAQQANQSEEVLASTTAPDESAQDESSAYKWLASDGEAMQEEEPFGLNCVCVELYRDNGDAIANTDLDQFIGFSLIMDDSTTNPEHYQFTNLPPGTYFARFYAMSDSLALSSPTQQSIDSETIAEFDDNTFRGAIAVDEANREGN